MDEFPHIVNHFSGNDAVTRIAILEASETWKFYDKAEIKPNFG